MQFTISLKSCFFLLFWAAEKGTNFKFQWNFTKIIGKLILNNLFLVYLMNYIAQNFFFKWSVWYLFLRIILFIAPTRSQKTTINFGTFVTGVKPTSWCLLGPWSISCPQLETLRIIPNHALICFPIGQNFRFVTRIKKNGPHFCHHMSCVTCHVSPVHS